jgi:hypothetical protein
MLNRTVERAERKQMSILKAKELGLQTDNDNISDAYLLMLYYANNWLVKQNAVRQSINSKVEIIDRKLREKI